jgi:rhodanese-related sulfurtransferase
MNTIRKEEILNLIERGERVFLVEALPESFFETGHLPGAISIPAGYVAELAPKFIPDKKVAVIVYCSSKICQNSRQALDEFKDLGYLNLHHYVEGKEDWRAAGYPLEKEPAHEFV